MLDNTQGHAPPQPCSLCSHLGDEEYALQKYGWEADNTYLPAAAGQLVLVKDLRPAGARTLHLKQCPQCGTYYLYRTDYEYLVNGTEDEEFLTRLTDEQAGEYLKSA
jgi:hypothetical protein